MADVEGGKKLARFGVIDIGSHTVRLVVFDGRTRSPAYFFNEKETCALGADVQSTGALYPEGKVRALAAIKRFAVLAKAMNVLTLEAVATAAVRDASDGPEFAEQIRKECDLNVRVISGVDEGRYAAMGVLLGEMRKDTTVVDIGGASMELTSVKARKIGEASTTPLGPLRLSATGIEGEELDAYIISHIREGWPKDAEKGGRLTLVGGGWRAFAALDMHRRKYPLHVLQGYEMTPDEALATADWVSGADEADLASAGLSKTRIANAPLTARVLQNLIKVSEPSVVGISAYGLREGVLFEHLPKRLRASDPLTQSAAFVEKQFSRFPGFGEELAAWLIPSFPDLPERLSVAACLLADVNWRIHPDYRAKACFVTATQANLGGLTHHERVFLAVALAYRYKGAKHALKSEPAAELLDADERTQAEALGRTIRLGAMISGAAPDVLSKSKLVRGETTLTLSVDKSHVSLLAGLVERRLGSLAAALGLEPVIEI
jgi:exopolyphosphatase/guanosine-5'-triphosphate,3'-diphosphate pyrophosphatase